MTNSSFTEMAQAQLDLEHYKVKPKKNTFHVLLDELHSVTVCKRSGKVSIGIYKTDIAGKRRGVAISQNLWMTLKDSINMIDLAIDLTNGTVFKDNGVQDSECYTPNCHLLQG